MELHAWKFLEAVFWYVRRHLNAIPAFPLPPLSPSPSSPDQSSRSGKKENEREEGGRGRKRIVTYMNEREGRVVAFRERERERERERGERVTESERLG